MSEKVLPHEAMLGTTSEWYAFGPRGECRYSSAMSHPWALVENMGPDLVSVALQRGPYQVSVKIPPGAVPLFTRRSRETKNPMDGSTVVPKWEFCSGIGYRLPDGDDLWVSILYDGSVAVMDRLPE